MFDLLYKYIKYCSSIKNKHIWENTRVSAKESINLKQGKRKEKKLSSTSKQVTVF